VFNQKDFRGRRFLIDHDGYGTDHPFSGEQSFQETGQPGWERPPHTQQNTMKFRMVLNEPNDPSEHLCLPFLWTAK
jgi:hypothetical protein